MYNCFKIWYDYIRQKIAFISKYFFLVLITKNYNHILGNNKKTSIKTLTIHNLKLNEPKITHLLYAQLIIIE